jgi:hypothetical protein
MDTYIVKGLLIVIFLPDSLVFGCLTEWLRCRTRNAVGNSRVGSNPAAVEVEIKLHLNIPFFLFSFSLNSMHHFGSG